MVSVWVDGKETDSEIVKKTAIIKAIKTWWKPWTWFRKDTFRAYEAVEVLHAPECGAIVAVRYDCEWGLDDGINWFVDETNGDDNNSGLSLDEPLATTDEAEKRSGQRLQEEYPPNAPYMATYYDNDEIILGSYNDKLDMFGCALQKTKPSRKRRLRYRKE